MRLHVIFERDFIDISLRPSAAMRGGNEDRLENGCPFSPLTIRNFADCSSRWIGSMSNLQASSLDQVSATNPGRDESGAVC